MAEKNDFQWRQFERLGEMIGDGLHLEEPWISREYNALRKILVPDTPEMKEFKKKRAKTRNKLINDQISNKILTDKCKCGGKLKQTRSGSKVVKCDSCKARYQYKWKKKK